MYRWAILSRDWPVNSIIIVTLSQEQSQGAPEAPARIRISAEILASTNLPSHMTPARLANHVGDWKQVRCSSSRGRRDCPEEPAESCGAPLFPGHGRDGQKVLDVRGKQVHTPASQTRAALSAADLRCVVVCAGSMGPPGRGDQQREYSSATDELSPVSIQSLDHHPSGEDLSHGVEEESNFKQLMLQVKADPVLATSGLSEGFYYKVCIKI